MTSLIYCKCKWGDAVLHEKADTLVNRTLVQTKPINWNVILHAVDTDIFFFIVVALPGDITSQPLHFIGT